jgi:hypothetical protein
MMAVRSRGLTRTQQNPLPIEPQRHVSEIVPSNLGDEAYFCSKSCACHSLVRTLAAKVHTVALRQERFARARQAIDSHGQTRSITSYNGNSGRCQQWNSAIEIGQLKPVSLPQVDVAAEVLSARGKPDEAARTLRRTIKDARKAGFFVRQLEATLTLAEIEAKSGKKTEARYLRQSVEKDARSKGFLLIAREAPEKFLPRIGAGLPKGLKSIDEI